MINGAYYLGKLRWLHQKIERKKQGKPTHGFLLFLDNAHVHKSQVTMNAATEYGFEILPHPLYSPHMAPSGFYMYLFPKPKSHLRGTHYGSNEHIFIQSSTITYLQYRRSRQ